MATMRYYLITTFLGAYYSMSEILLNKFEKEKRVIELHLEGKTIRDIAKEVHMSFKDIGRIIKTYEKQQAALKEKSKNDSSHTNKKISKNSQAFKLFREGKKLTDVAIELEIPARKAVKLWSQFLRLERMYESYEFYKDYQYDIPRLLTINNFIKNNHVNINNIADILKEVKSTSGLQLHISILKHEIETLKQTKIGYGLRPLEPLRPLPRYYNW
jgi:transposase